jgi:hypothetical protein
MGARVNEVGSEGFRIDVEDGSNGDVVDGVSRALRFVDMLSSMLARERRRKSRSTRVLKQNCGVSFAGAAVGLDIMGGGGGGEGSEARLGVGKPVRLSRGAADWGEVSGWRA